MAMRRALICCACVALSAYRSGSDAPPTVDQPSTTEAEVSTTTAAPTSTQSTTTTRPAPAKLQVAWRAPVEGVLSGRLDADNLVTVSGSIAVASVGLTTTAQDLQTGATLWRMHAAPNANRDMPPVVVGDRVPVAHDQRTVAVLDARTGRELWTFRAQQALGCEALSAMAATANHLYVVGFRCTGVPDGSGTLIGVSMADGSLAWHTPMPGAAAVHVRPEADGSTVVVGTADDVRAQTTDTYRAFDASTGRALWARAFERLPETRAFAISQPPRIAGDVAILPHGSLVADIRPSGLDLRSGEVRWHAQIRQTALIGTALVGFDPVRLPGEARLALMAIDVRTGQTLWRDAAAGGLLPSTYSNDPLVVVTDRLVSIDTQTGKRLIDVETDRPSEQRFVSRRGFIVGHNRAIVVSTTPASNATVAETVVQLVDLQSGKTLTTQREGTFAASVYREGDWLVLLVGGHPAPSELVAYRLG